MSSKWIVGVNAPGVVCGLFMTAVLAAHAAAEGPAVSKEMSVAFESPVILTQNGTVITQADVDAYLLARVPEDQRGAVLQSAERIAQLLQNLLSMEAFVTQARATGFLDQEETRIQLYQALSQQISDLYREQYLAEHELDDYEQQAREIFLAEPERFLTPETVDFHHILVVAGSRRSEVEAMSRVVEIHQQLVAGADFVETAREYSDDPTFEHNQSLFEGIDRTELVAQVAAALGRTEPGQISDPVRSRFGWHIVRLEGTGGAEPKSWEEVREQAAQLARQRHRTQLVERFLRRVHSEPVEFAEGAIAALVERYGVSLHDRPTSGDIGRQMAD